MAVVAVAVLVVAVLEVEVAQSVLGTATDPQLNRSVPALVSCGPQKAPFSGPKMLGVYGLLILGWLAGHKATCWFLLGGGGLTTNINLGTRVWAITS